MDKGKRFATLAAACVAQLAATALVMWLVSTSGTYPGGGDAYAHLARAQALLDSVHAGDLCPLVSPQWYNGAQVMRFWGPLTGYALAALVAVAGSALGAYVLFCGLVYLVGALGWLNACWREGRPFLGLALGALWFLLPANLCALFQEGDLSRALCLALVPTLLGVTSRALGRGGRGAYAGVAAASALVVLADAGYAVLVGLCLLALLVCHGIACHEWGRGLRVLLAVLAGCAVDAAWLVPFVAGGGFADVSQAPAQSLAATLAPQGWLSGADAGTYLGLAAAVLAVFGIACSRRESRPAFLAAALLVACTAQLVQPVVGVLTRVTRSGSLGLVSLAAALLLLALARWRSLRRPVLAVVLVLLAIDALPSWKLLYGNHNGASAQERLERDAASTLVDQAREVTVQRLALVDEAGLDAESAYLATSLDGAGVAIAEGSDSRAAVAKNYEQLDRALEEGRFAYLFDRSVELGCDSVIVRTSLVQDQHEGVATRLDAAAGQSGYLLVAESGDYRLYHRDVEGTFGVRSTYRAAAIGAGAGQIALQFPAVEECDSACLDDYTADQLSAYDVVYLDGFTYTDHDAAEGLVRAIAASGTRVVIMADGIPADEHTGDTSFLGVSCQPITFHGGFPELTTNLGQLSCALFPSGHELWQTVYVNGLEDVWGSIDEEGRTLPFMGTTCGGNVVFVGLNLTYFETVTADPGAAALLAEALDLDPGELPSRELVPIQVSWSARELTVESPEDGVSTTLAWQDVFVPEDGTLVHRNNLLVVDAGETRVRLAYPLGH